MSLFENVAEQIKIYPGEFFFHRSILHNRNVGLNIFVIGCGGTGSYLIPNLARLLSVKQVDGLITRLFLCDADEVEEKNLLRQNFIQNDIGKNKASVLATRYSKAFGIPIAAIEDYFPAGDSSTVSRWVFDSLNSGINLFGDEPTGVSCDIIISCVDNVKTRLSIADFRKNNGPSTPIWIDTGNEEFRGQVVFSDYICEEVGPTPDVFAIFPNMLDQMTKSDHPDALSCADHALSAPQNIGANMTSAQCAFNYFNIVYHNICTIKNMANTNRNLTDIAQDLFSINHNVCFFNIEKNFLSSEAHFGESIQKRYAKYGLESKIQKGKTMFSDNTEDTANPVFHINGRETELEVTNQEPAFVEEPRLSIFNETDSSDDDDNEFLF